MNSLFIILVLTLNSCVHSTAKLTSTSISSTSKGFNQMQNTNELNPIKVFPLRFNYNKNQYEFTAASGLVHLGSRYFIIADDELKLGTLSDDGTHSELITILPGTLPTEPKERKKLKPDFESLFYIEDPQLGGKGLVAMPSGSKPQRFTGVFIPLTQDYKVIPQKIKPFNVSPLFHSLLSRVKKLNIEGSLVSDDILFLFHRGNTEADKNWVFKFRKTDLINTILGKTLVDAIPEPQESSSFNLGTLNGVTLTFSDSCYFDGKIYFLAAAEDTSDAVEDGKIQGTVLGEILSNGSFKILQTFYNEKYEGLSLNSKGDLVEVSLVTDNDNPNVPSKLSVFLMSKSSF